MKVIHIKNWNKTFENYKSRSIENCGYVCVPNKQHGMGLATILDLPDGAAIYGIWCLMLGAASRQGKHRDGWLTDTGYQEGTAWVPQDMAVLWRRPVADIERALEVLASKKVGWVELVDASKSTENQQLTEEDTAVPDQYPPGISSRARAEQNRTEQNKDTLTAGEEESEGIEHRASRIESNPQVTPPTLEQVQQIAASRAVTPECAESFWNASMATGWVDGRGQPIRNWTFALNKYAGVWRANDFQRSQQSGRPRQDAPPTKSMDRPKQTQQSSALFPDGLPEGVTKGW